MPGLVDLPPSYVLRVKLEVDSVSSGLPFLVQVLSYTYSEPGSFFGGQAKAVCRWFENEKWSSLCLAGFEMTEIFEESLRNLREFKRLATVTFEHRPNFARR